MNIEEKAKAGVLSDSLCRPDWTVDSGRSKDQIWLDKNENLDPELSKLVTSVYHSASEEIIYGYPDLSSLYKKLANFLNVMPSNLLLSHGSDGVIKSVFEVFISPGNKVLITSPTFIMYELYARMFSANIIKVDYQLSDYGPMLKLEQLIKSIKVNKPKLVCLANPDSPTGTVFQINELKKLISACLECDAIILIDEAYYHFCDITALPWISTYSNLIITRTFAKAWGMAGLRIGYAVGAIKIISLLHRVRPMYEINSVAASVVEKMLDYSDYVTESVNRLNEGMDYFLTSMNDKGFQVINGAGNFAHVKFGFEADVIHKKLNGKILYKKEIEHKSLHGFSRFSSAPLPIMRKVVDLIL